MMDADTKDCVEQLLRMVTSLREGVDAHSKAIEDLCKTVVLQNQTLNGLTARLRVDVDEHSKDIECMAKVIEDLSRKIGANE